LLAIALLACFVILSGACCFVIFSLFFPRSATNRLGAGGFAYFLGLLNYMLNAQNAKPRCSLDNFEAAEDRFKVFELLVDKHKLQALWPDGKRCRSKKLYLFAVSAVFDFDFESSSVQKTKFAQKGTGRGVRQLHCT
jgi:hypothetical protein